jgi:hypothetical protein
LFSPGAVQRVLGLVELALPRGERGGRLGDAVRVLGLPAETELLVALENLYTKHDVKLIAHMRSKIK